MCHDLSETDIVLWKWDFGDGNSSFVQNPDHVYENLGIYDVKLVVSNSLYPNIGCTDSIIKQVNVGNSDYFSMGGHIMSGLFPIDSAWAYLYEYTNESIIPVDTAFTDTLGYYYFYQKPKGNYLIKAKPHHNSSYFGSYMPTYYQSNMNWQQANIVELNFENFFLGINLIEVHPMVQGVGNISGETIFVDSLGNYVKDATNIEMLLLNSNHQVCKYTNSNSYGDFYLNELPFGGYTLLAEVAGIQCEPMELFINEANPDHSGLVIEILTKEVSQGIEIYSSVDFETTTGLYPNPASHTASIGMNIRKPATLSMDIYNQVGRLMLTKSEHFIPGHHTLSLNIADLDRGFYFVRINAQTEFSYIEKLVVY